jgi:hypothetical protein
MCHEATLTLEREWHCVTSCRSAPCVGAIIGAIAASTLPEALLEGCDVTAPASTLADLHEQAQESLPAACLASGAPPKSELSAVARADRAQRAAIATDSHAREGDSVVF